MQCTLRKVPSASDTKIYEDCGGLSGGMGVGLRYEAVKVLCERFSLRWVACVGNLPLGRVFSPRAGLCTLLQFCCAVRTSLQQMDHVCLVPGLRIL